MPADQPPHRLPPATPPRRLGCALSAAAPRAQVRDLEAGFAAALAAAAPIFLERYGAAGDSAELEALQEDAQARSAPGAGTSASCAI